MESNNIIISVIWWYETVRQSGTVVGPLMLLVIQPIHVNIFGGWKIDKLKLINLVLSLLYFITTCLCQTKLCNVSKIYDQMIMGGSKNDKIRKQDSDIKRKEVKASDRRVMKWSSLLQIDIIFIVLLVSLGRYCSTMCNLVVIATKFSLGSNRVYPISLISSAVFLTLVSIVKKLELLKGKSCNVLFIFLGSVVLMAINLNTLLLTATNLFDTVNKQLAYLAVLRFTQLTSWFLINTLGSFLLFRLVNPEDSSFVTGFRGLMSSFGSAVSHGLTFTSVYHPGYLVPWVVIMLIVLAWMVMFRKHKYL